MTRANEFLKALQDAQKRPETVDEVLQRQKAEWLQDLRQLAVSVADWLAPLVNAAVAKVLPKPFDIEEPDIGSYEASGLEISLVVGGERRVVLLRPRGMRISGVVQTGGARIIGARGRVDIECGVTREILLRFREDVTTDWVSFARGEKRSLDEDVFFELLARVADVPLG